MEKITDNEIIKALECCTQTKMGCEGCPFENDYSNCRKSNIYVIDLIKRQKAEIERLNGDYIPERTRRNNAVNAYHDAKAEAIKEFAEKVKEHFKDLEYRAKTKRKTVSVDELESQMNWVLHEVSLETIDNLAKEMTEQRKEDEGK